MRSPAELSAGADDGIGDQLRQMAGDREHGIVEVRRHDLDLGGERLSRTPAVFIASAVRYLQARRFRMHTAVDEQLGKPGNGRKLGAGHGVSRPKCTAAGIGRHVPGPTRALICFCFSPPPPPPPPPQTTSETIAPGLDGVRFSSATRAAGADREAQETRSAPSPLPSWSPHGIGNAEILDA